MQTLKKWGRQKEKTYPLTNKTAGGATLPEREKLMIKLLELFGGIGACTQAFKRLGIAFEIVGYVEIDKFPVKSYNAINGTNFEPQDIRDWNKDIDVDFIMHGSPRQDFSVAGNGKGAVEGGDTRSSLMYETIRIVEKIRPKYVLWENVKNVLSQKHRHNFENYLQRMESMGYHNYYQVLNAKDYGIPQNRERIFVLSCLEEIDYHFPEKEDLYIALKDLLEDEVEDKYYISSDKVEKLVRQIADKQGDKGIGALINQATSDGSIFCKEGGGTEYCLP